MIFFTSDQHYGHNNVIRFCDRPFGSTKEMNQTLIDNHNSVVSSQDTVYHLGDFSFRKKHNSYLKQLNGSNVLLRGSHDKWNEPYIRHLKIDERIYIVMCHWPMRSWHRSSHGSWQLFGHWHGEDYGYNKDTQYDVGVDNNDYYPVSLDELKSKLLW